MGVSGAEESGARATEWVDWKTGLQFGEETTDGMFVGTLEKGRVSIWVLVFSEEMMASGFGGGS